MAPIVRALRRTYPDARTSLEGVRPGLAGRQAQGADRSDPGDDEGTKELFRTGRTMGVFYTESPASRAG
jgi:hypothetical protein